MSDRWPKSTDVSEAGTLAQKEIACHQRRLRSSGRAPHSSRQTRSRPARRLFRKVTDNRGCQDPHEILEILGPSAVQEYLIEEIQKSIACRCNHSDKHLEVIISRMLSRFALPIPVTRISFGATKSTVSLLWMRTISLPKKAESRPKGNRSFWNHRFSRDGQLHFGCFLRETTRVLTNAATLVS